VSRIRFAEFEFDRVTVELRRQGEVVRLQPQPAQVLGLLIDHAGEIVTRDALRDAIWGGDTFVDFDKGLNFAIAQVRAALGDSAEAPRFIRTFPKRGYQFIARMDGPAEAGHHSIRPVTRGVRLQRDHLLVAIAILIAIAAGWIGIARRSPSPAHTIAVTRFDNQTGLAEYDRYAQNVTDAVVADLTASGTGRFAIIGNAAALRVPREQRDIVAIGQALRAGYIVLGQVQRDGSRVRILAHLIRLPEQTHLWVTRIDPAPQDPGSAAADVARRISSEFLGKL
jgi:DNA-binding winged helix-turn-helix (wHTH) protein/TolB-like protein